MKKKMKKAFITGITGQDGSWLCDLLVAKGYEVTGLVRRTSTPSTSRIRGHVEAGTVALCYGDMADSESLNTALKQVRPDEVYHLAAQSHVGLSFELPVHTADVVALGTARLLEAVRRHAPEARLYNACSSEIFGNATGLQDERTPLAPRNPYAAAKVHGHLLCHVHREAYAMHVCSGILFNHESERRGERFVTRKITRAVGRIVAGTQRTLMLGNLDARRDWGHAEDYVEAMWRMLQRDTPADYVIATGTAHSVRDFAELAFEHAGLTWSDHVEVASHLKRPADVDSLCGDASKATRELGWRPTTDFATLVRRMVEHDIALAERERDSL